MPRPVPPDQIEEHFWSKVARVPEGCWEWQGCVGKNGYGVVVYRKVFGATRIYAHRLSHKFTTGAFPSDGLVIRHSCDNRTCVRPSHLEVGTQYDNVMDQHKRGRFGQCKLTWEQVEFLRANYQPASRTWGAAPMARRLGVHRDTVEKALVQGRGRRSNWDKPTSEARRGQE